MHAIVCAYYLMLVDVQLPQLLLRPACLPACLLLDEERNGRHIQDADAHVGVSPPGVLAYWFMPTFLIVALAPLTPKQMKDLNRFAQIVNGLKCICNKGQGYSDTGPMAVLAGRCGCILELSVLFKWTCLQWHPIATIPAFCCPRVPYLSQRVKGT